MAFGRVLAAAAVEGRLASGLQMAITAGMPPEAPDGPHNGFQGSRRLPAPYPETKAYSEFWAFYSIDNNASCPLTVPQTDARSSWMGATERLANRL
jgi:hypothetical protein